MEDSTIIRVERSRDNPWFTTLKAPFENKSLSWEAKGLLAYLFTKPDGWTVRFGDLIKHGDRKRDGLRTIFRKLEAHGYVERVKVRRENGTFEWETTVREIPNQGGVATGGSAVGGDTPHIVIDELVINESIKTPPASSGKAYDDDSYVNDTLTNELVDIIPPSLEEDPWEGREALEAIVPPGSRARRDDYKGNCDQCASPLDQGLDVCPDCKRPVEWVGSAIADKRYRREKAKAADGKAKELRAMMVTGSTSAFVLSLACATSPSGKCEFAKGEADRLEAYAAAYGVTVVTNLASKLKSDGDRGRGLIKHLLNKLEAQAFEKAAPGATELTYEERVKRYS